MNQLHEDLEPLEGESVHDVVARSRWLDVKAHPVSVLAGAAVAAGAGLLVYRVTLDGRASSVLLSLANWASLTVAVTSLIVLVVFPGNLLMELFLASGRTRSEPIHVLLRAQPLRGRRARTVRGLIGQAALSLGLTCDAVIWTMQSASVNAVHWRSDASTHHLAVTTGMLDRLDNDSLVAVFASLLVRTVPKGPPPDPLNDHGEFSTSSQRAEAIDSYAVGALIDARDADAEALLATRNPRAVMRALTTAREAGGELDWVEHGFLHPSCYFAWPFGGDVADEHLGLRIGYLHRLEEVKPDEPDRTGASPQQAPPADSASGAID